MPSIETLKMEDRKRPALDDDARSAPPLKRQALSLNGASTHPDADMPWKDDIEAFQKDAILRRMQEHKREAKTLKDELDSVRKHAEFHDEHLRAIDSWFSQLVDEIALLCNELPPLEHPSSFPPFESSILTAKTEKFKQHLDHKSDQIKSAISKIFTRLPSSSPDTARLQERLSHLLAAEKNHTLELTRLRDQAASLDERLENASMRYMMAEKKVDRLKSQPVQKLEAQAKQPPKSEQDQPSSSKVKTEDSPTQMNGILPASSTETDSARQEAVASRDRMKEHLDRLAEENKRLTDALTAAQSKYSTLSDEDYSHTELYRTLRSQHEDVIKRVNDLQALHVQLRGDIKQLQAERTHFKEEADKEQELAIKESESQVTRLGLDLARIRNERDNAQQDLAQARAEKNEVFESSTRSAELAAAKEQRIAALESEVERLRLAGEGAPSTFEEGSTQTDAGALQARLRSAEKEKEMLVKELGSMETAYKRALAAGSQKLSKAAELEERITRANAEKMKADQKFFQTMKAKEAQANELRLTKAHTAKTSDIVTSLKESESNKRSLVSLLEKQIADLRDNLALVESKHRDLQQREYDFKTRSERLSMQVEELQKQLVAKDEFANAAQQTSRQSEAETAELKVRLEEANKNVDLWRKRSMGSSNDEYDMLKQIATCTICRKNFKEVALTKCGHVFCQACVDERYNSRARKCPNCGAPFGQNDRLRVTL